jgi:hypothetical protein
MINKVVNKIKGMNICESVKNCVGKTWKKIDKSNVVVGLLFFILGALAMNIFNELKNHEVKDGHEPKKSKHEKMHEEYHNKMRHSEDMKKNSINNYLNTDTLLDNGDGMMR